MTSPQRTRLSRDESRQRTRQRLLEAARAEIASHGVAGASVRNIAEAAGYSQGAFYSNFADKESLLVEVTQTQMLELADDFQALIEAHAASTLEETLTGITQWLKQLHANPTLSMLTLELQMYAKRNPGFGASLGQRRSSYLNAFAEAYALLFRRHGRQPPLSPLHVAIGFIALWQGFSVQLAGDHPIPADEIYLAFLRALFQ